MTLTLSPVFFIAFDMSEFPVEYKPFKPLAAIPKTPLPKPITIIVQPAVCRTRSHTGAPARSRLLSSFEAADFIDVDVMALAAWRAPGRTFGPKFVRIDGKPYYRKADLRKWLERHPRRERVQ